MKVKLFDVEPSQVSTALENIKSELLEFEEAGTLRGTLPAVEQGNLITGTSSLKDCVQDAIYIQECIPENLELKIKVWTEIDGLVKIVAKRNADGTAGQILGVHMVGPWVTEQLSGGYLAVNWEATVAEVAEFIQPHPSLSELFGETVLSLTGRSLNA